MDLLAAVRAGFAGIDADPALKERAIERTAPLGAKPGRYRPPDELLEFLEPGPMVRRHERDVAPAECHHQNSDQPHRRIFFREFFLQ